MNTRDMILAEAAKLSGDEQAALLGCAARLYAKSKLRVVGKPAAAEAADRRRQLYADAQAAFDGLTDAEREAALRDLMTIILGGARRPETPTAPASTPALGVVK